MVWLMVQAEWVLRHERTVVAESQRGNSTRCGLMRRFPPNENTVTCLHACARQVHHFCTNPNKPVDCPVRSLSYDESVLLIAIT